MVNLILWILSIMIADFVITLLHELAHKRACEKKGVKARVRFDRKGFRFFCYFDEKKLIGKKGAEQVFLAGIKSDLVILGILTIVLWTLLFTPSMVSSKWALLLILLISLRVIHFYFNIINLPKITKEKSDIENLIAFLQKKKIR